MPEEKKFVIPPGTGHRFCRECGYDIYFIPTEKGKIMPVDPDGTPHWSTCTNPGKFRKKGEGKP